MVADSHAKTADGHDAAGCGSRPHLASPLSSGTARVVGITVGDPAGTGPELIDAALDRIVRMDGPAGEDGPEGMDRSTLNDRFGPRKPGLPSFRLYGPAPIVERVAERFRPGSPVAGTAANRIAVEAVPTTLNLTGIITGRYTPDSGAASLAALRHATADLVAGQIDSLVTGPISKQAFTDAGLAFPGQTEFVASAFGCTDYCMMLGGPVLKVALVTTHLAVRDIADAIREETVLSRLKICDSFIRQTRRQTQSSGHSVRPPRIGVTALNPHCGDNGRFGDEEFRVIAPAIRKAVACGIDAVGPISADTVFRAAMDGAYDMVLAMYHDQGLGPLKLVHFNDAINVTMGLPAIRCSPDHGPAFDIAGTGRACPTSLTNAVLFAAGIHTLFETDC